MFGFDLSDMKEQLRNLFDAQWRTCAGAAFMALAMVAIQYDEVIAPGVSRVSDAWSGAATDLSRRVAGFAL
jgi:hypothetical protein